MHTSHRAHGTTAATTTKPSLMQRLRGHRGTTTTKTKHSHNPFTGADTVTTTEKTTTHGHTQRTHHRRSRRTHESTVATGGAVHHHQRRPSFGDKVSGAMLKLKGTLSGHPGEKAAGTRRMRGTDGRGARHY